jgi:hypothetical protein
LSKANLRDGDDRLPTFTFMDLDLLAGAETISIAFAMSPESAIVCSTALFMVVLTGSR